MADQATEQVTQQIIARTVRNLINGFLIDRRSRVLLTQTNKYYGKELSYFCSYLNEVSVVNLDVVTSDLIRQYLLNMRAHRYQCGVTVNS